MGGERMTKRSIGSLMRKKLSDITNSQPLPSGEENSLETFPTDKDCIEQLLKERVTLMQLLAERNKVVELSGAELQRQRSNIQKLQLQNWNLAQSNSQMLAELNLGKEKIKALQHEILCKAALIKGAKLEVEAKVGMNYENNIPLPQEREDRAAQPRTPNEEKHCNRNRRRTVRSRSTGSSTASTKDASKEKVEDKRPRLRRHSAKFPTHEHEALENLFEIEDAKYPVTQSGPTLLSSPAVPVRDEGPRSSFGRPLRKAVEKVQSYKERPLKMKLRRLE